MIVFLGRRLLLTLPTLLGVALVVFLMMRAIPGDVVTQLVGVEQEVTPERMAELRRIFGLDLPIHVQFGQWLGAALQGDLGTSLRTGRSIMGDLLLRFPATLQLSVMSLGIALALALPIGILAARVPVPLGAVRRPPAQRPRLRLLPQRQLHRLPQHLARPLSRG